MCGARAAKQSAVFCSGGDKICVLVGWGDVSGSSKDVL